MSLVVLSLLGALLVGAATGGRLQRLRTLRLRRAGLVLAALAAQLAGAVLGGPLHGAGLLVSAGLVVAFLAANRGVRGTGLVGVGLAANALVVTANGAMPVTAEAAARAGVDLGEVETGLDPRHELAGPGTRLTVLGDVVPLPLPLRPEVVSPGDVLVAAGLAQLVVVAMRRPAPAARQGRPRRALPPLPARSSTGLRSPGVSPRTGPARRPAPQAAPRRAPAPPSAARR